MQKLVFGLVHLEEDNVANTCLLPNTAEYDPYKPKSTIPKKKQKLNPIKYYFQK